ncbi:hypothetical protein ATCC90586_004652 [Pythium insidiosum]|nr:hypothetical protein ATCC90586_004652 [Pythium insidiosum]
MSARVAVALPPDADARGGPRRSSLKYALSASDEDASGDLADSERLDRHTILAKRHSLRAGGGDSSEMKASTALGDSERRAPPADAPRLRPRRSQLQLDEAESASPRGRSETTTIAPSTTVSLALDLRSMSLKRVPQQQSRRGLDNVEDSVRERRRRSTRLSLADPSRATTVYSPRTSVAHSQAAPLSAPVRCRCSLM